MNPHLMLTTVAVASVAFVSVVAAACRMATVVSVSMPLQFMTRLSAAAATVASTRVSLIDYGDSEGSDRILISSLERHHIPRMLVG